MTWKLIEKALDLLRQEKLLIKVSGGSEVSIALVYPNTYYLGMSNLGIHSVFALFNSVQGVICERAFLPEKEEIEEFRKSRRPLFSLDSQKPLQEFDAVAFSISYELDFANVLKILELAGIPLYSARRDERHPLIIAGGPIASLNPEPVADFVDAFAVGEGEGLVENIAEILRDSRGIPKEKILQNLSEIKGLYIPKLHDPEKSRIEKRCNQKLDFPTVSSFIASKTEFSSVYLMEISRGCPHSCRFCMVSYCNNPFRVRSLENLEKYSEEALKYTEKIGLVGATATDYPHIEELCLSLLSRGAKISFASLRADRLTKNLVRAIAESGQKTLTIAPETPDEGFRKIINKNIKDESIFKVIEWGLEGGIKNFKYYFMIGLPGEKEDINCWVDFLKASEKILEKKGKGLSFITAAVNQFVPKPHTPLQWHPQAKMDEMEEKRKLLKEKLKGMKRIKLNFESMKEAFIQGLLARGDRKLSKVLARVYKAGTYKSWIEALERENIDPGIYLFRERSFEEHLPWEHIVSSLSKDILWRQYQNMRKEIYAGSL